MNYRLVSLLLCTLACTLSSAVDGQIGPDLTTDGGECIGSSCPNQHNPTTTSNDDDSEDLTVETYEVAEVGSYSLLSSLKDTCYSVVTTVKDTVIDNAARAAEDFADTVREVFKDELFGLVQNVGSMLAKAFLSPDSLLTYLGETAMSVCLFLLCLLLTYIVLQFRLCSFVSILAFNCFIFLLHHFLGPVMLFRYLYHFVWCVYTALSWMVAYPYRYITCFVLASYFIWKIASPLVTLIRWTARRVPPIEQVRLTVADLSQRLAVMEKRQIEMLTLLQSLRDRGEVNGVL